MSTQEILAELPRLSSVERAQVAKALHNLTAGEPAKASLPEAPVPQFGLHAGAWEVANDLDEPLPDELWLGEDA